MLLILLLAPLIQAKILNGSITTVDLADSSVTNAKLTGSISDTIFDYV